MPSSALAVNYSIPEQSEHGAVQSPAPLSGVIGNNDRAEIRSGAPRDRASAWYPAAEVRVTGKSFEMKGRVRSCTFDLLPGFFIDVELYTESRWSAKRFVPQAPADAD
jgi:hypothetical protein